MNRMDIVACTDKWFVMPTGVMMYSVCVNNPDMDIVFHVITDDCVTDDDKNDLEDIVVSFKRKSIVFYPVSKSIRNNCFPALENTHLTEVTYYRLWLTKILPNTIDKILYLDGDIIVRHSLLSLWNTDLEGYALAAVADCMEGNIEYYNRLGYPSQYGYFNAGALLINLKYWRENGVLKVFSDYISNYSANIKYHDQDILNVLFRNCKIVLPLKYNLSTGFLYKTPYYDYRKYKDEIMEARMNPDVLHFSTSEKPWHVYQRYPHPYSSTWYKYQDRTKWKGIKYEHRPFRLRAINFVADTLRRWQLKPQITMYDFIDIAPID